ncbi:unnamed protein product, partial [Ectocarpus fasciculatus]
HEEEGGGVAARTQPKNVDGDASGCSDGAGGGDKSSRGGTPAGGDEGPCRKAVGARKTPPTDVAYCLRADRVPGAGCPPRGGCAAGEAGGDCGEGESGRVNPAASPDKTAEESGGGGRSDAKRGQGTAAHEGNGSGGGSR